MVRTRTARRTSRLLDLLLTLLPAAVALALAGAPTLMAQPAPVLDYSTYLGGSQMESVNDMAVDADGNVWVVGTTWSDDFPLKAPLKSSNNSLQDAFIAKLDPRGRLLFATYFGGLHSDQGFGVAVDAEGNAYVTGCSYPIDFPLAGGLPAPPPWAGTAVFVAKLDPAGSTLLWSTLLGGGDWDCGLAIALGPENHVYVAGRTKSRDFPRVRALPDPIPDAYNAPFVVKLSPEGDRIVYSTLLGGSDWDDLSGHGLAVDAAGHAVVTGFTKSVDFPLVNPLRSALSGVGQDAFLSKIAPDGGSLVFSTYLGGSGPDTGYDVAADGAGNLYATGVTRSPDFPLLHSLKPAGAGSDAYVVKITPEGELAYSTRFGGTGAYGIETPLGIAVDAAGRATVGGYVAWDDFPVKHPVQAACSPPGEECFDAFVFQLSPAGPEGLELVFSTLLGGRDTLGDPGHGWDYGRAVALDAAGNVFLAGETYAKDFPVRNAIQPLFGGGGSDGFVARIRMNSPPDCSAAFASPATLWPPDGRMVPIAILGVTDPDGDPVALRVTAIHQDEPLSKKGQPDSTGLGTATPALRADRAGSGDGRVYHIAFEATDPAGAACTGTVTVCVPHDQGKTACGDGGPLVDPAGGH